MTERTCPHCNWPIRPNDWIAVCFLCRQHGCPECMQPHLTLTDSSLLQHDVFIGCPGRTTSPPLIVMNVGTPLRYVLALDKHCGRVINRRFEKIKNQRMRDAADDLLTPQGKLRRQYVGQMIEKAKAMNDAPVPERRNQNISEFVNATNDHRSALEAQQPIRELPDDLKEQCWFCHRTQPIGELNWKKKYGIGDTMVWECKDVDNCRKAALQACAEDEEQRDMMPEELAASPSTPCPTCGLNTIWCTEGIHTFHFSHTQNGYTETVWVRCPAEELNKKHPTFMLKIKDGKKLHIRTPQTSTPPGS